MIQFRLVTLLAVCLLAWLPACGGGGGGAPVSTNSGGLPVINPLALTRDLLEDCGGATTVDELQALVSLFSQVVTGQGAGAGFEVQTGQIQNVPGLVIPWTLDADGDATPEGSGVFAFEDAAGNPISPFSPAQLLPLFTGGIAGLGGLFAVLPDGSQFILAVDQIVGPPSVTGEVRASFVGGQPTLVSGLVGVSEGGCASEATWANVTLGNLLAGFPSAVLSTRTTRGTDVLVGTLTLNGTNIAVASVSLNAAPATVWNVNLTTGAVSQVP
ncbi:MAG: hypothetical protein O2894_11125 [Planctomycetota bacterium]|nr:hypothetical protein [Planctomycetota bacterium]